MIAGGTAGATAGSWIGGGVGALSGWLAGKMNPMAGAPSLGISLPPGLLEALVHQESGGHQYDKNGNVLRSSAGALGIAQLMPATARGLGVNPNDAADNLRGGAMLLSQLLKHYSGNEAEALAAYNGEGTSIGLSGRTRASTWIVFRRRHGITSPASKPLVATQSQTTVISTSQ